MKPLSQIWPQSCEKWALPIDVERYDRNPYLTNQEIAQLAYLKNTWEQKKHLNAKLLLNLDRLVVPLNDVMALVKTRAEIRSFTIYSIASEMYRSRSTFWAWTKEKWLDMIKTTPRKFGSKSKYSDLQTTLIAFGYFFADLIPLQFMNNRAKYLAYLFFGEQVVEQLADKIRRKLLEMGYSEINQELTSRTMYILVLCNRDPRLETITLELMDKVRREVKPYLRGYFVGVSYALKAMNILPVVLNPLKRDLGPRLRRFYKSSISDEWFNWCEKWAATATYAKNSKRGITGAARFFGHWLYKFHPEITKPEQITREIAIEFVGALETIKVGELRGTSFVDKSKIGQPISPKFKASLLQDLRVFFHNLQEWGLIQVRFNTQRCFATPRSLRGLVHPKPRIIQSDIWAKLLWAGLNLAAEDLPRLRDNFKTTTYPLEMMRALTMVWLFAGLRSDEISRLRVGCIRWQQDLNLDDPADANSNNAICILDVPVNKTSSAFSKPVDAIIGESIEAWERVRPPQMEQIDSKTGERVHFLFMLKSRRMTSAYINSAIIPMLCRKAGVPIADVRGNITSHRARATIASQLFNAKDPMSLYELQAWLGHTSPESTKYYAEITPTKLIQSFAKAGYFERNIRAIEVLIDKEAVKSGVASKGEPFIYYDLGHGYCTYDFFDQCPHRMACPKCSFYLPKDSSKAQLLEAKTNLMRLKQEIPLSTDEIAAVEDGLTAIERLYAQLVDIPAPDGQTPRQLVQLNSKRS